MRRLSALLTAASAVALTFATRAEAQAFGFTLSGTTNVLTLQSISVGPLAANSLFSLSASGQVFVQGGNTFGTNAAGVVVTAGTAVVGSSAECNCFAPQSQFGAVLARVNGGNWFQLFPTTSLFGLGSPTPPTTVSYTNATVGSVFGGAVAANSTIDFRIADINDGDNSGSYTVSANFGGTQTTVPEPSTVALLAAGLGAVGLARRRALSARGRASGAAQLGG